MDARSILQTLLRALRAAGEALRGAAQSLGANEALVQALTALLSGLLRYLVPLMGLLVVVRCARSLFQSRMEREQWGTLVLSDGTHLPLDHWENLVGRARTADVRLPYGTVSRTHAALIRDSRGAWRVHALHSKNGVEVNGVPVDGAAPLRERDLISFGGVEACFLPSTAEEERQQAARRVRPGKEFSPAVTLILLSLFQGMLCFQLWATLAPEYHEILLACFGVLCLLMWSLYVLYRVFRRTGFEIETLAFFLTTLCLLVTADSSPAGLGKQTLCVVLGLIAFFALSISLRSLELVKRLRWPLAGCTVALLTFNVLFGARLFGAKNWLTIGPISFQPSEFVKIVFILVGATTLDRMFNRKNLLSTLLYSVFCMGCLGLMSDFGTALIFFVALLAITFLRSGDLTSVLFLLAAACSAGYIVLQFKAYIFERFAIYRHVWEDPANLGYQQTRTMSAIASGGLFGRGVGNGWLKGIGAANTDLVFGVLAEEVGLLLALTAVTVVLLLALFAVREAVIARSSFYVISACSAAMIFIVQTMLNVFGSTDLLPLTGVTLPFVSCGGSSMISCWALLAFIKASDTRQNAGLAVRLPERRKKHGGEEPERWDTVKMTRPEQMPEPVDDASETILRRPKEAPLRRDASARAPSGDYKDHKDPDSAERARKVQDAVENFPEVNIPDEGYTDADNWRDYFLPEEEWEDKS